MFEPAPRTPPISISSTTTEVNLTGSWKNIRPEYHDRVSPCAAACPTAVDIEGYMSLLRAGHIDAACDLLLRENPMPAVTGRVCNHPCEDDCNRARFDSAVAIHAVERMLGDRILAAPPPESFEMVHQERIAIVGSGPAGLGCAYHLARLGYRVTVFEQDTLPGGMLRAGIPAYRLPRAVLDASISHITALGVDMQCGTRIGRDVKWPQLTHEYAAIFIATGAHISRATGLSAPDPNAISSGLDFLRRVNRGERPRLGRRVLVVGGGNTAIDCARTAFRLGGSVTLVYRRTRAEMPAIEDEIDEAEQEGVRFEFLAAPTKVRAASGGLQLVCNRMRLGEPDASGRRKPVPANEPPFTLEADTVLTAIGEDAELAILPDEIMTAEGSITDEWGCSRIANIFLGGDVANETRTVASALGAGKRAAIGIDRYLRSCRGENFPADIFEQLSMGGEGGVSMVRWTKTDPVKRVAPLNDVVAFEDINLNHFERVARNQERHSRRMAVDAEVNFGLSAETALQEAARCFECGVCNECELCQIYCSDAAIVRSQSGARFEIRMDYCKGCGVCAVECPRGAIVMAPVGGEGLAASGRLRSDADVPGTREGL